MKKKTEALAKMYFEDDERITDLMNFLPIDEGKKMKAENLNAGDFSSLVKVVAKAIGMEAGAENHMPKFLSAREYNDVCFAIFLMDEEYGEKAMYLRMWEMEMMWYSSCAKYYPNKKDVRLVPVLVCLDPSGWRSRISDQDREEDALPYGTMLNGDRLHVISPEDIKDEDRDRFRSDLWYVMKLIAASTDREKLEKMVYEDSCGRKPMKVLSMAFLNELLDLGLPIITHLKETSRPAAAVREERRPSGSVSMEKITWIMEHLNCGADRAMDVLGVSGRERDDFRKKLMA